MDSSQLTQTINSDTALHQLIGQHVEYLHKHYEIVDLLLEENQIILSAESEEDLQEDCYGRAHRMVPCRLSLRFRDEHGQPTHIWDELLFIDRS
ncbi:MAG: hypothetical protein HQM07_08015 [Zetaproteobacteria bacterium]|nr:hypothetical protein [Zetaproteobacteria bacterium]